MKQYTADFRQFANIDPTKLKWTSVPVRPPTRVLSADERKALKSALAVGGATSQTLANCEEIIDVGFHPPTVRLFSPLTCPPGFAVSKSLDLTISAGLNLSGYIGLLGTGTAGLYGSTTREIGVFATVGTGIATNAGVSAGVEYTFIFGTPNDFRGVYIGAGIGVSGSTGVGVSGMLLFSPGPPLTLMGYSLTVGVSSPSPIPVTVTLDVTNTWAYGLKV